MSRIEPPKLLLDLYRDLRDRRLLAPVIALVVAILAVPVLLGGSEAAAPPAPVATPLSAEGAAVEPAVLVEQSGIRNYRERLAALKAKNPFQQQFVLPANAPAGSDPTEASSADAVISEDAASSGGLPASTSSPAAPTPSAVSPDESVSSSAIDPASGSTTDPVSNPSSAAPATEPPPAPPKIRFYAGRIDVSMGPIGEGVEFNDVRYLSFLPNDEAPVVAYVGLLEGGDQAIFSVSSAVSMGRGEGSCAPKKPAPCQFLTLKVGEERYMTYGTDGATYRLKLLDTEIVSVPDPRDPADRDNLDE